jgi:hypothetical protein
MAATALKVLKRFVPPSKRALKNFLGGVFGSRHWSRGGAAARVDDLGRWDGRQLIRIRALLPHGPPSGHCPARYDEHQD